MFTNLSNFRPKKKRNWEKWLTREGISANFGAALPIKSCLEKHFHPIPVFNGKLYGYPGHYHEKHYKDVNVWLISTYVPPYLFTTHPIFPAPSNDVHIFLKAEDRKEPPQSAELLISYLTTALKEGKSVAISCFGGHGRTGTFLSILYGLANTECSDPINAIRKMGCDEWVESEAQAKYIFKVINKPYLAIYNDPVPVYKKGWKGYENNNPHHISWDSYLYD